VGLTRGGGSGAAARAVDDIRVEEAAWQPLRRSSQPEHCSDGAVPALPATASLERLSARSHRIALHVRRPCATRAMVARVDTSATEAGVAPASLQLLEGILERVVYANEATAWSVVRLAVPGKRDVVTAVGNLLGVQPGENLRLHGAWVTDRRYGEQFRVHSYVTVAPATLVGMERYLGSGLVRGIGKVMAERLVRHFGLDTLDVIERRPEQLTQVDGIGPVRRDRIAGAWTEQREIKEVMLFLQSHGVSTSHAVRIYKEYGNGAIAVVSENPYRLAIDVFGIGFKTADRIATSLGIEPTSPRRAEAGVLHQLGECSNGGHLYYPRAALVAETAELLGVEAALVETALGVLAGEGRVAIEPLIDAPGSRIDAGDAATAVYLASLHHAEVGLAERLRGLAATSAAPLDIDVERALAWIEEREGIRLSPGQRDAVRAGVTDKVLVITGGPGTGKTTVVNAITRILARKGLGIVLTAPTGRAAKRMTEATGRDARTIHRLLEFSPGAMGFARDQHNPIEADVVVVDETSMVDVVLAYNLLKAIPPRARLIVVGDVDQLPSVGPGSVLADLIRSRAFRVVALTEIFRQAAESLIVTNAHRVNRGEMPTAESDREPADFYFIERAEPEEVLATLKDVVTERIPSRFGLDPVDDVQVLTPMNRGLLGAANLNVELQALLNPGESGIVRGTRSFRVGDKVMQIRNNYTLDVFNGDIGRIAAIDPEERIVTVRYDNRPVAYDYGDLDELVLAYACSIHKAQGSEYSAVVIPVHTQHFIMLQRNLLYTALTRGKRLVVLVGTRKALAIAVKNHRVDERYSRLAERLRAAGAGR
jgi:exodeoxyribonuclease V alpha subunit